MEIIGLFFIIFLIVLPLVLICILIYYFVSRIISARKKREAIDKLPVLSVKAKVVARRMDVTGGQYSTRTIYFVTFETDQKERIEFRMDGSGYAKLIEGDLGTLTYQGERYKGFQRDI
jgi:hypothetical protein